MTRRRAPVSRLVVATYEVSGTWMLASPNGMPTVLPPIEDDVVEVTCRSDDQMTDWRVNDTDLVGGACSSTSASPGRASPRCDRRGEELQRDPVRVAEAQP